MTAQRTRDQLREAAEGHLRFGGGGDDLANGVLALLDQLDRAEAQVSEEKGLRMKATAAATEAEHRIARLEAQTSIRGRAVVMYRERARKAETRIKAVRDVLDDLDQQPPDQIGWDAAGLLPILRRALESVPPPRA